MGLWEWITVGSGFGPDELARRLGIPESDLHSFKPSYSEFTVPKRGGGRRRIQAPDDVSKRFQRLILRRLLARLPVHGAVTGFEPNHSIVTNALPHVGQAVVVRMDIKNFFDTTRARRVRRFFRKVGWNRPAAALLVKHCTRKGGLPQGAPTSPRLSNLVNYRLDARLEGLASSVGASYSRYADDMTFSLSTDNRPAITRLLRCVKLILADEGYSLHQRRKLHIRRFHQQQIVTGLVVNDGVNLPRKTRRLLRAVEHHHMTGRPATLTPTQLLGWKSLQAMIKNQSAQS